MQSNRYRIYTPELLYWASHALAFRPYAPSTTRWPCRVREPATGRPSTCRGVDAYATATLMGENTPYSGGASWQWPRCALFELGHSPLWRSFTLYLLFPQVCHSPVPTQQCIRCNEGLSLAGPRNLSACSSSHPGPGAARVRRPRATRLRWVGHG